MRTSSRRGFLIGLGATGVLLGEHVAGHVAYDALLQGMNPEFWKTFMRFFASDDATFDDRHPGNLKAAKTLFGGSGDVLKLVGGRSHYQYLNSMHPDDKWGCETIWHYAACLARTQEAAQRPEQMDAFGSFVCIGSPVSNAWTRLFLEYTYIDKRKPGAGLVRLPTTRLKLPFEFVLSREMIQRAAKRKAHRAEARRMEVNWSIRSRSGHILEPNTDDKETDLLLVSRIPNWIEREATRGAAPATITIFAGTHGVGTSAVRLLLADSDLLRRILLKAASVEYWQVLLTVKGMDYAKHPYSKRKRLVAQSLGRDFEFEPVYI
jgi:hypothetical protein